MSGRVATTLEALAAHAGLVLPKPGEGPPVPTKPVIDPSRDEVLGWLDVLGMVKGMAGDGIGYEIDCPWMNDHTDRAATGTAYWPGGGFKCHHGHCQDKGRRELEAWLDDWLYEDSGGVVRLSSLDFPSVVGGAGGAGAGAGAGAGTRRAPGAFRQVAAASGTSDEDAFFAELIYLAPQDAFVSLATRDVLPRAAVDAMWCARLEAEGCLPVVRPRTGDCMAPSRWYLDVSNGARARRAGGVTYWPGKPGYFQDPHGVWVWNKWVAPDRPGLGPDAAHLAEWLALVKLIAGQDGPDVMELVLDWFALVVGSPGTKPGWHVLVHGGQGIGKDLICQPAIAGVGREDNWGSATASDLHSGFNGWAEKRFASLTELRRTTRGADTGTDQYAVLKALTENTNQRVRINQKYMREYYALNTVALYVTSNEVAPMVLDEDDRRFLVVSPGGHDVTAPWPGDRYARLAEWMKAGGDALIADWLWDRWDAMDAGRRAVLLGRAPRTAGKGKLMRALEDPAAAWARDQIELDHWPDLMTSDQIGEAFAAEARRGASGFKHAPTPQRWAAVLRRLGADKVYGGSPVKLRDGNRRRLWAVRQPQRFERMSENALAQAHASAAGHAFADKGTDNVVEITTAVKDPSSLPPHLEKPK